MSRTLPIVCAGMMTALVAVLGAQQVGPARDSRSTPPVGRASLSGTVTAIDSPTTPIANAQVGVFGTDNGVIRLASSDAQGRFVIAALPAGRYLLSVSKAPYVDTVYGATQLGRPGTAIALADAETRAGLSLALTRGAVITGTVTDERGEPAVSVSVDLVQPRRGSSDAQMLRTMLGTPQTMTDDRGVFRFSGLAPGDYFVSVTPNDLGGGMARVITSEDLEAAARLLREPSPPAPPATQTRPAPNTIITGERTTGPLSSPGFRPMPVASPIALATQGPTVGFAPIFYPGSADIADATMITVTAGEERRGVDVVARPVPTTRVEGLVLSADGQPAPNVAVSARSTGRDQLLSVSRILSMMTGGGSRTQPDGRFTLSGLPPGKYTLEARSGGGPNVGALGALVGRMGGAGGSPGPAMWASAEFVASGEPLTGLVLRLQPGLTLSGRIAFDASSATPPKELSTVMVGVRDTSAGLLAAASGSGASSQVAADGTFTVSGLMPGRYLLSAGVTGQDPAAMLSWLQQTVTVAGRDVSDLPIEVRPDHTVSDVVITLSDRQQELTGTLQDAAGRPAPDFTVLLFAADKQYWLPSSRRILTTRPGTDGRFAFRGPLGPPVGEYILAAVTDLRPDDEFNPAFLEAVAKAGIRISLAPGQSRTQDIRIIGK